MAATVRAPGVHADLLRWFGSSWDRWREGQIWRLVTSTFVQSRHGFVAGIVVLIWLLALAEWRIGSRLAALVFLTGDWVSSVTVALGARVMAAFGSAPASRVLAHLDSGASSACYACGGAFVSALPPSRLRNVLAVVLLGDLAVAAVVGHMLADIQHPIAALVGAALVRIKTRRRAVSHA
jgi:hypothetical protein